MLLLHLRNLDSLVPCKLRSMEERWSRNTLTCLIVRRRGPNGPFLPRSAPAPAPAPALDPAPLLPLAPVGGLGAAALGAAPPAVLGKQEVENWCRC